MLQDFVLTLYKLEVLSFLKNISFLQKKVVASKIKSGTENLTSMIYKSYILELYFRTFHVDINIVLLLCQR